MIFPRDFETAMVLPSPNCGPRQNLEPSGVSILLLHYTGMATGDAAERRLRHPESEVSSHYLIHEDGRIVQFVPEAMRAWHAGASSWKGRDDVNSRSIGVEIANPGHEAGFPAYPEVQIDAVVALCRSIVDRYGIEPHHVLGHSDVSPGRKLDPGPNFPWSVLAEAEIGHLPRTSPISAEGRFFSVGDSGPPVEALQTMLALYGYAVPIDGSFGDRTRVVVESFQSHYRQERVDGVADFGTIEALRDLLDRSAY